MISGPETIPYCFAFVHGLQRQQDITAPQETHDGMIKASICICIRNYIIAHICQPKIEVKVHISRRLPINNQQNYYCLY